FTAEQREAGAYDESLAQWESARRMNRFSLFSLNSGQALIISLAMAAMLLFAAYYVLSGDMTLGDSTLVNAFMFQLFLPLYFLGFIYRDITGSMAKIERMVELLDAQPAVPDDGNHTLNIQHAEVELREVGFAYAHGRTVLTSRQLRVPAGQSL